MWRWLKRILLLLSAGALLWLAVVLSGLLPWISAEQAADLADLRLPPQQAVGERNALELLWSLRFDVPPEQRAAVLAEDAAALDAWLGEAGSVPDSVAAARYPLREAEGAPELPACDLDCLARVRADPETWRAAVGARASRLQALESLAEHDHQRTPYRFTLSSPLPSYRDTGSLQIAAAALRHVDGDSTGALQALCHSSAAWRGLRGRSDTLIAEMINLAWLRRSIQLYADIRAELPPDAVLPEPCEQAFAPPRAAERMSCDVFRSEFKAVENSLEREPLGLSGSGRGWQDAALDALLNREATLAMLAGGYRRACAHLALPLDAWPPLPVEPDCPMQQRLFNPVGCALARIGAPNYLPYLRRERDLEGHLRLLALAEHLVDQDDPARAFENRPEPLRQFEQPVRFEDGALILDLIEPRNQEQPSIRLALPGSLQVAAQVDADDPAAVGGTMQD